MGLFAWHLAERRFFHSAVEFSSILGKANVMKVPLDTPILCPVLIGRVHDLTALRLLADRAKSGQGQIALLSGEAGIGKSRLVAEVKTAAAAHDFLLVQGSCFPTDHAIPYAPLLDFLRSFLTGHSAALPASEVQQVAQAFLPLLPEAGRVLSDIPPAPVMTALDPEQEKRRRFETLAHFLTDQTRAHPVLLWCICVVLGRLYQTQACQGEADQAFSSARALIEELAASLPDEQLRARFLSQATAMLPQKRPLTPGRVAREAFGGLTAREREVAALIAQGKINREIAEM